MSQLFFIIVLCLSLGGYSTVQETPPNSIPLDETTPPAEEILARAVQSIGGRKQLHALESFQLHGVMRLPDNRPVVEIELSTQKGGKVLGVMTYIGVGQTRFGSDGVTAWEQNLNSNNEETWTLIDSSALSQKVQQMNWLEWFTMLPMQLENMQVIGSEEFDDEMCWKVQILNTDEKKNQIVFFSKQTYRPKGRRSVEKTSNGDATIDIFFRDWERVGKLLLFHTIIYKRDETLITMKLNSLTLNKAKEDLFHLPQQIIQLRDANDTSD